MEETATETEIETEEVRGGERDLEGAHSAEPVELERARACALVWVCTCGCDRERVIRARAQPAINEDARAREAAREGGRKRGR